MKFVGIDLAGKPENASGFCILTDEGCQSKLVFSDDEIVREIEVAKPDCIGIDAPFWMPYSSAWRSCDEKLIKRGFQPVSTLFPTMKILVIRASRLVRTLKEKGFTVIEVFSSASEAALNLSKEPKKNKDEYDALLSALTAKAYSENRYESLDGIIIPK